jgi:hypothetical protein
MLEHEIGDIIQFNNPCELAHELSGYSGKVIVTIDTGHGYYGIELFDNYPLKQIGYSHGCDGNGKLGYCLWSQSTDFIVINYIKMLKELL